MTKRLKAYIKRTVLASAVEYAYPAKRATKESKYAAFRDYANGTDTGVWSDLIYTVDVLNMFNRYRADVAAAVADYMDACGVGAAEYADRDRTITFADILVACAKKRTVEQYHANDVYADAAQFGIRFACEYLLQDVSIECGVEW